MTDPAPRAPALVAVAASAGGLEALQSLFTELPADTGAAFVVIQHLSPDFHSRMDELLGRITPMPVAVARDGQPLRPNHVHLIPRDVNLEVAGGALRYAARAPRDGGRPNFPADQFFKSMAEGHAGPMVAVVLSGSGSDGAVGARAVNAANGLLMVQDPESAEFTGMPKRAIATQLADVVGPPTLLAQRLVSLLASPPRPRVGAPNDVADAVKRVIELVRSHHNVELAGHKPATLNRRIERRTRLAQLASMSAYVDRLEADPIELQRLVEDLLIGVTAFFRDPRQWRRLSRAVMPQLLANLDEGELRMWCCGCSTGEEAYSLAILAFEAFEAAGRTPHLRIFATDVNQAALETATAGLYPPTVVESVGQARIARFFDREHGHYRVKPALRRAVVFAPHDVTRQTPFSRLHLVSCRNMLIYLQPATQQRVLHALHYGLQMGGTLFLGAAEEPLEMAELSTPIEGDTHMLRKTRRSPPLTDVGPLMGPTARPQAAEWLEAPVGYRSSDGLLQPVLAALLRRDAAFGVVVNRRNEVVHVVGRPDPWFRPRGGAFQSELTQLMPKPLALSVVTGLHRARNGAGAVSFAGVPFESEGQAIACDVEIVPFAGERGPEVDYLVFKARPAQAPPSGAAAAYDLDEASRSRITALETDLQQTHENLQATIEELQTTSEQQQAGNDALRASNEALQSTNEELYSVNEELHTVNAEYESKIRELTALNGDLDGLLGALDIGILFLDEHLRVRRFNPRAQQVFRVEAVDLGRALSDLTDALPDPATRRGFYAALEAGEPWERAFDVGGVGLLVTAQSTGPRTAAPGRLVTVVNARSADPSPQATASLSPEPAERQRGRPVEGGRGPTSQ